MTCFDALEGTTKVYSCVIEDQDGAGVPAASLTTMTLTLYDVETDTILNSRDKQDVLNTNDVAIDGSGNLAWTIQPDDNAIVSTTISAGVKELHRALFEWTYSGGTKHGKHQIDIRVENLNMFP